MTALLYLALFWLPLSVAFLKIEVAGATVTLYVALLLLLTFPTAARYLRNARRNRLAYSDLSLLAVNAIMVGHTILGSDAYKYVHGLLMPSVSYFVVRELIQSKRQLRLVILSAVGGGAVFGIIYVVTFFRSGAAVRIDVFERDAIAAGTIAAFMICMLLIPNITSGAIRWLGRLLAYTMLAATLSRGYVVTMIVVPLLWWRGWHKRMLAFVVAGMVFTLLITVVAIGNVNAFKPEKWEPELENSVERLYNVDYWKNGIYGRLFTFVPALKEFESSPVFGGGWQDDMEGGGSTVHNFHLEWLASVGLVGYLLIIAFVVRHFEGTRQLGAVKPYVTANLYFVLVVLLNGLTNGVMHGVMPYLMFISLGLTAAAARIDETNQSVARRRAT